MLGYARTLSLYLYQNLDMNHDEKTSQTLELKFGREGKNGGD